MKYTARSLLLLLCSLTACGGGTGETPDASVDETDASSVDVDADSTDDASTPGEDGSTALPCSPGSACEGVGACLAEVDQTGASEPALRIAQLTVSQPTALASGFVGSTIATAFLPNDPDCNLPGAATANWIFRIASGGDELHVGAARPRESGPYTLIDETFGGVRVAPAIAMLSGTTELQSEGVDVVLPVFLDPAATQTILFPLHSLRVTMTPDASRTCVGAYDAASLDPEEACLPSAETPAFVEAGTLTGYVDLEEADTVTIAAIAQSLCVLLSGDPASYGDGGTPISHCKRTDGEIEFQGDWCAATNSEASAACHDALRFTATFAASGISL